MTTEKYKFKHEVSAEWVTPELINDLHEGAYGILCVTGAGRDTIKEFGKLLKQDMYGREEVTIGIEDEEGYRHRYQDCSAHGTFYQELVV